MIRRGAPLPILLFLAAWLSVPLSAQAPEPEALQQDAGIQQSLERVAAALEALLAYQETDLLLKRIEMRERRIAPLEDELRRHKGDLVTHKAELDRLETLQREWGDRIREAGKTDENAAEEWKRMEQEFELAYRDQSVRYEALQERVRLLEDDLIDRRKQIQDLEARLLDRIDE